MPAMPIKIMGDYGCHPLWWDSEHPAWSAWGGQMGDIDPLSLGITPDVANDLQRWAAKFDAMLNLEDPASTSIPPEVEAALDAQGRMLSDRLARELGPKAHVRYWRDRIAAD